MVYCFQVRFNFSLPSFCLHAERGQGGNFAFRLKGLATFQCISSSFFPFLCFLHLPALYIFFSLSHALYIFIPLFLCIFSTIFLSSLQDSPLPEWRQCPVFTNRLFASLIVFASLDSLISNKANLQSLIEYLSVFHILSLVKLFSRIALSR